jgi:ABC-type Mn2+/Zn2+ transport system permease subunit
MAISVGIGLVSAVAGLVASYYLNTASGPTTVMVSIAIFVISLLARGRR